MLVIYYFGSCKDCYLLIFKDCVVYIWWHGRIRTSGIRVASYNDEEGGWGGSEGWKVSYFYCNLTPLFCQSRETFNDVCVFILKTTWGETVNCHHIHFIWSFLHSSISHTFWNRKESFMLFSTLDINSSMSLNFFLQLNGDKMKLFWSTLNQQIWTLWCQCSFYCKVSYFHLHKIECLHVPCN